MPSMLTGEMPTPHPLVVAAAQRLRQQAQPQMPAPVYGSANTAEQHNAISIPTVAPQPVAPTVSPDYQDSINKVSSIAQQQEDAASVARANALSTVLAHVNNAAPAQNYSQAQPYTGPTGSHQLQNWVDQALQILHMPEKFAPGIENLIMHESGGNPNSINRWDSNAKAGHPSQGLMQTIPGTFQEYALPGYNHNIDDPISNIIAGVRYALANYGRGMLLAGGRHDANGNYIGY